MRSSRPSSRRALGLSSSSLGLLTSVYFMAFALMQIPTGMLLDRFGPRRIEPILLSVAACGALVFAASDTLVALGIGRALIGAGVSVCLMAPLKAIATWYPVERQASYVELDHGRRRNRRAVATVARGSALGFMSWRVVFVVLAAARSARRCSSSSRSRLTAGRHAGAGIEAQWSGVRSRVRHPRFWWIAPLSAIAMGSFMAIQGLWSVPWMMDVKAIRAAKRPSPAADELRDLGGYFVIGSMSTASRGAASTFSTGTCSASVSAPPDLHHRRGERRSPTCSGSCTGSARR